MVQDCSASILSWNLVAVVVAVVLVAAIHGCCDIAKAKARAERGLK